MYNVYIQWANLTENIVIYDHTGDISAYAWLVILQDATVPELSYQSHELCDKFGLKREEGGASLINLNQWLVLG